jgi:transposase InsO family protein/transposase-like protein
VHERWIKQAKLVKLSAEGRLRLEWIIHAQLSGNVAKTCRRFDISRSVFYKWRKVFNSSNILSLESKSRAPLSVARRQATPAQDQRVIDLRKKYPYFGKMKILVLYKREYGNNITSWYIQRVIQEYGLYFKKRKKQYTKKKSSVVKKKITEFKTKPSTGFLLHLDTIVLHLAGVKRYVLTAIDDHSKISYARAYKSHASISTVDFFKRLNYVLKNKIVNVHTDNGCEFHKHFEQSLKQLKLTHWWSRVRTPKDNPSNERFNRTFREEFLNWGNFNKDTKIFNKRITDWLVEYNSIRPHETLNYLTPLEFARKSMQLSTMWSSCTSP